MFTNMLTPLLITGGILGGLLLTSPAVRNYGKSREERDRELAERITKLWERVNENPASVKPAELEALAADLRNAGREDDAKRAEELAGYLKILQAPDKPIPPVAGQPRVGALASGHLSSAFFRNTERLASSMRSKGASVSAFDLLNVWLYESGIGRAKQGHGGTPYYGLNMMWKPNLPGVGWTGTAEEYRELDPAKQVAYVGRFYDGAVKANLKGDWTKLNNATALYLMNFLPIYSKHADDPNFVLARKGEPKRYYEANSSFDHAGKGYIQVSDLTDTLARARSQNASYWKEVVGRQKEEAGSAEPGANVLPLLALLAAGGALTWWFVKETGKEA